MQKLKFAYGEFPSYLSFDKVVNFPLFIIAAPSPTGEWVREFGVSKNFLSLLHYSVLCSIIVVQLCNGQDRFARLFVMILIKGVNVWQISITISR